MAVFVVIATRGAEQIGSKIAEVVGDKHYVVSRDSWLTAYDGTTKDLAETLGIRSGETGSGLVLLLSNYSGRANPDVWEWLKLHWGEQESS